MDLHKVLAHLREEVDNLNAAIVSLERLQQEGRRRGRPLKTSDRTSSVDSAGPHKKVAGEDCV
jgi:hypothetical protein